MWIAMCWILVGFLLSVRWVVGGFGRKANVLLCRLERRCKPLVTLSRIS